MAALKPIRNRPGSSGPKENPRELQRLCSKAALNQGALAAPAVHLIGQLWKQLCSCGQWSLIKIALPAPSRIALTQLRSSTRPAKRNSSDYTQFWQLWNMAHLHAIFNFVLPDEKQIWQISCQILYTFYQMNKQINKCGPGFWQNLQLQAGYTQFLVAETAPNSTNFLFDSFKIWQLCSSLF